MHTVMKLVSPLTKVFLEDEPTACDDACFSGFQNEVISFQAAYRLCDASRYHCQVSVRVASPLPCVRVRRVMHVPVSFATYADADDNYLRKTPGLYPDLLRDVANTRLHAFTDQWQSLWIDVSPNGKEAAGDYPVTVTLCDAQGESLGSVCATVRVLPGLLPPLSIRHTKWLHCDGIAQHYGMPMWSEPFWTILERFVARMASSNIDTLLTPIHTPPLDTAVGGERMTCQLVDVRLDGGRYTFGFEKLHRWVAMAERCGIRFFEMAHLFTQWGAHCTPKVEALVDGVPRRIFGWDVPAQSDAYRDFLACYLPALTSELRALGIAERCFFHISDEPGKEHVASYLAAKALAAPHLPGLRILDAMSDPAFYQSDPSFTPVAATNHIAPFLDARVEPLWAYYCLGQYKLVSNQFMAMPSARTRILGAQLFKFGLEGFLHWGFNFYSTQYSTAPVDPYAVTDGDGFAPAGDTFQVYPGPDGTPEDSIRLMMAQKAFDDHRALCWLAQARGRAHALRVLDETLGADLAFDHFPHGQDTLLNMRARIDQALCAL